MTEADSSIDDPGPVELILLRELYEELGELAHLGALGIRYIHEIYQPDLREPYSIANRRDDLANGVFAYRSRRGMTRKP